MAVNTGMWVLWEYENGRFQINVNPTARKPVRDYVLKQGRFSHLRDKEEVLEYMQSTVDEQWRYWEKMDEAGEIILPWLSPYAHS